MSKLLQALRERFSTPQEALQVLGLDDEAVLEQEAENVIGHDEAPDSKLDNVNCTTENITMDNAVKAREATTIVEALTAFLAPKLAKDQKLEGLEEVLATALDEWPPKKKDESKKDDEDSDEAKKNKKAKDAAAKDCDKPKAQDEQPVKDEAAELAAKKVLDDTIKTAMDEAIAGERTRQLALRDAERFVRPWIGDLAVVHDCASDVYKAALEATGKKVDGIDPSAFRAILEDRPKPGSQAGSQVQSWTGVAGGIAMDTSSAKSYADMFPDAARIGRA